MIIFHFREILRHVQNLSNPLFYRNSRRVLLQLRQSHPHVFQNSCLFSEVASRLGTVTYRLPARRFLQELFLDLQFNKLYIEPTEILEIPTTTNEQVSEISSDTTANRTSPIKNKINGRVPIPEIDSPSSSSSSTSEINKKPTTTINTLSSIRLKAPETIKKNEKLSDEEIIAEILKPAERLKISKNSENKLSKVTGTNTAISLD